VWIWWDQSIYNNNTSQNTQSSSLLALTMIDPATGWFETVEATNKSATFIQDLFHITWLARYPQPQFIVFENGSMGEFKHDFEQMFVNDSYFMKAKPTISHKQMQ
jgi:hypothetical protein